MLKRTTITMGAVAPGILAAAMFMAGPAAAQEAEVPGLAPDMLRLGGVMDLEGRSRGLGRAVRAGIDAALRDQTVRGRRLEFVTINDSFSPERAVAATEQLLNLGVFAMLGNVGSATTTATLPILMQNDVPAIGFFAGSDLLRYSAGPIINYRVSDVEETSAVVRQALDAGMAPDAICAYVQNDAFGMAGVRGIRQVLAERGDTQAVVAALDQVLAMGGEEPARNNIGPVGVYRRNTFASRDGYESLKDWESRNATICQLVVTVGTYNPIAKFIAYSRYKGEVWVVSAVSFTGAGNFREALTEADVTDNVIMTQVVPPLDSDLPLVRDARRALGSNLGYVSLEGYIVGRLFLKLVNDAPALTREAMVDAAVGKVVDLGGLRLDFRNDNQGSDLVLLTMLTQAGWQELNADDWSQWVQ